jgi:hypothetical protein
MQGRPRAWQQAQIPVSFAIEYLEIRHRLPAPHLPYDLSHTSAESAALALAVAKMSHQNSDNISSDSAIIISIDSAIIERYRSGQGHKTHWGASS